MKNYLLPIYHSKFKPWIKWWLLKQLELRSKTLSDWIEGTTPITIRGAFKEKIQNLEFEGNTSQTGTPTPEAPIPVRVVKEDNYININGNSYRVDLGGKNKLPNTATTQTINGVTFTVNEDKSITLNGTSTSAIEFPIGMCESLDVGTYKGNCASNSSTSSYYIRLGTNNTSSSGWLANVTYNTTVTLNSITNVYALLIVKNEVSVNNITIYPQLEKRKYSNSLQSLCI